MKTLQQLALATAVVAAIGCAGSTDTETADALMIPSSPDVSALGIAQYGLHVDDSGVDVQLLSKDGSGIGFLAVDAMNQGKVATLSTGGRVVVAELLGTHMVVSVDGEQRASFSFDMDGLTPDIDPRDAYTTQGALTDIQSDLETLVAIASDPALRAGVAKLRDPGADTQETAYMFGLDDCPGWIWVGGCTGLWPVCAYCVIAWL